VGHGIIALGALAAALLVVAPRLLGRVAWFDRAPRWGIACWLATAVCAAAIVGTLPIAVALHLPGVGHDLIDALSACPHLLSTLQAPSRRLALLVVAVAAFGAPLWIGARVAATQVTATRRRRAHRRGARLAASNVDGLTLTLDHALPAIYCIPGRQPAIVVTSGARRRLSTAQLAAAQAHERAHLAGHHHLLTALTGGLARALPGVAVVGAAQAQVRRLVEIAADEAAVRGHDRGTLADALAAVRCGYDRSGAQRERRLRTPLLPPLIATRLSATVAVTVMALSFGAVGTTIASHGADCSTHTASDPRHPH
jgi:Zn-dependent protease with chaperone function